MKWNEISEKYPNQFVLLKALKSHVDGDRKIVDDVALVKIIETSKEANELLIRSKGDTFVFHTSLARWSLRSPQAPPRTRKLQGNGYDLLKSTVKDYCFMKQNEEALDKVIGK
jgi:hypothetical protein